MTIWKYSENWSMMNIVVEDVKEKSSFFQALSELFDIFDVQNMMIELPERGKGGLGV